MSLRLEDLHPIYRSVSPEEARIIANLGAEVYVSTQASLRAAWSVELSAEEMAKADRWHKEGRAALLEEVRPQLEEAAVVAAQLADAKAALAAVRASVEAEADRRAGELLAMRRVEFELEKRDAVHALETQLAELRGTTQTTQMLGGALTDLKAALADSRATVATLQADLAKYKQPKSSHALGKQGEAEMVEMLNLYVLPRFPYSELKDVSKQSHVGDVHVWLHGPTGKRTKVMVDVKKYTTPIQRVEVEKLYSDLDGDAESQAGLMISMESAIYSKSQFQIVKTPRNKPCMFLTFEKLDDGLRQEILCWALRVLVGFVALNGAVEQEALLSDAQAFLGEMNASLVELESCVRSSKALYDMLRKMKEKLTERIGSYQPAGLTLAPTVPVATPASASAQIQASGEDVRCRGVVRNGERCKSRRTPPSLYCARHHDQSSQTADVPPLSPDGLEE
jgi:F0F1-type ATP synthase membrane subunit b/b'